MKQYLDLCRRIVNEGEWIANERTGKRCLTVINADLEYDVANNQFPLITTRKSYWKAAIAEFLGYIRGYDNAADFRKLGTKTWDANANENAAWLANPHRKGTDDMGRVYGVQGRAWRKPNGETIDQLRKIVNNLSRGIDDRGEILQPADFFGGQGCTRLTIDDAQAAEDRAIVSAQRYPGVKADVGRPRDQRIVTKTRIDRGVGHDHGLFARNDELAKADVAMRFGHIKAKGGLRLRLTEPDGSPPGFGHPGMDRPSPSPYHARV